MPRNADMDERLMFALINLECEIKRAMSLHAPLNSAHEAYAVILEELDEFKQQVWLSREKRNRGEMNKELIQIAAMALRTILDLNLEGEDDAA